MFSTCVVTAIRETRSTLNRNLFQYHYVHHKSHTELLEIEPGPRSERRASNRPSRSTVTKINRHHSVLKDSVSTSQRTLRFHCKGRSINAVCGNNSCLFLAPHETQIRSVRRVQGSLTSTVVVYAITSEL
jgi:hypothetical protein